MQIQKIDKSRLDAMVLWPRSLYRGLTMQKIILPKKEDYTTEQVCTADMGTVTLIRCAREPHRKMQLIECADEGDFDNKLGILLGMHESPAYVEGDLSFMVLFIGSEMSVKITQENYRQVDADICHHRDQAARWWKLYGNEEIK